MNRLFKIPTRLRGLLARLGVGRRPDAPVQVPPPPDGAAWKAALVGVGGFGSVHAQVLAALPRTRLAAVADRSPEALGRLPPQLQPPHVRHYADAAEMFKAEALDLVSIATNTPSHTPLARAAAAAGIRRIVVEKPLGTNLAEVDALLAACERSGTRLSVNQSRRWSNDYGRVAEAVQRQEMGALRLITMVAGPGGLAMLGVHFLDLMRWLAGAEAVEARAVLEPQTHSTKWGAGYHDPAGWGTFRFANGVRGFIDLSSDLRDRRPFVLLRCEAGRIEIDEAARCVRRVPHAGPERLVPFAENFTPAALLRRHFAQILSDAPAHCAGGDGRAALEMVLAMHVSHQRGGAPVPLPLAGADRTLQVNFP